MLTLNQYYKNYQLKMMWTEHVVRMGEM